MFRYLPDRKVGTTLPMNPSLFFDSFVESGHERKPLFLSELEEQSPFGFQYLRLICFESLFDVIRAVPQQTVEQEGKLAGQCHVGYQTAHSPAQTPVEASELLTRWN